MANKCKCKGAADGKRQPIVKQLRSMLTVQNGDDKKTRKRKKSWRAMMQDSIREAGVNAERGLNKGQLKRYNCPRVTNLKQYYCYLDWLVTWGPQEIEYDYSADAEHPADQYNKEVFFQLCKFYWILDQPSGRKLQENERFRQWMVDFANDWGSFLNTPASFNETSLKSFIKDPNFKMWQYLMPATNYTPATAEELRKNTLKPNAPSGWQTFNQFFAREMNPGLRPVAGVGDDSIIVSPADSTHKAKFPISDDSRVTIKFTHTYDIEKLLQGSEYKERFRDGLFVHNFLGPNDYHRFHAPVRGTVVESRAIQERVYLDVDITKGEFDAPDNADDGYEFYQTRGVLILDSPIGLVAVIPIGMAQVSSVNMTAQEGVYLNKGEEFGYFLFGGSDIILLFEQKSEVTANLAPGVHYNSGMCVAQAAVSC